MKLARAQFRGSSRQREGSLLLMTLSVWLAVGTPSMIFAVIAVYLSQS